MKVNQACLIRKAAILGAGVMGAQIAAQFANAGIEVILFDLPAKEGGNQIIDKALANLAKLKPAPLMAKSNVHYITAANYEEHLSLLQDCDFVLEVIAEKLVWKEALYQKIMPFLSDDVILASNTSGLSVNHLAEFVPNNSRTRFCGVHFFNPPRYMALVEIIPSSQTDDSVVAALEAFLVTHLGKKIVHAKDTPNFVANRVGVFSMLLILHHAEQLKVPFEVVDALTGPLIGRPKSATLRTADVVGLDTFSHTITTMRDGLTDDPWHDFYQVPDWLAVLIEKGALGQKTRQGIYKKVGKDILVYEPSTQEYRASTHKPSGEVKAILADKNPSSRLEALSNSSCPHAQFLWACYRDLFHYCAYHLHDIAHSVRDIDQALRWGFGWKQGPFETWQSAGWQAIAKKIADSPAALPAWVATLSTGPYENNQAYSPLENKMVKPSDLAVYQRQLFAEPMLTDSTEMGETIFETKAIRLWHNDQSIAVLTFKTKMAVISSDVIAGINEAVDIAERDFSGLVVWQGQSPHFSAGANLKEFVGAIAAKDYQSLDNILDNFQQACLKLRYCRIPTVAAVRGYAFGGGCELMLHCDRVVAAAESYIGLVEAGVGLLPAGGGCKEMVCRSNKNIKEAFEQIAMAKASSSAAEAKAFGYLRPEDIVIMNSDEILYVAQQTAQQMMACGYRPPISPKIQVEGLDGIARLQMMLVNMREGGMISQHDYFLAGKVAEVLCGGEVEADSWVDESWLLRLEREAFIELATTEKSLQRIEHTLKTGKPLRN